MSYIDHYIDRIIITKSDKNPVHGYTCDVCDVPEHEIFNLTDLLLKQDDIFKEIALDYIQKKIDKRLEAFEPNHRYQKKLRYESYNRSA